MQRDGEKKREKKRRKRENVQKEENFSVGTFLHGIIKKRYNGSILKTDRRRAEVFLSANMDSDWLVDGGREREREGREGRHGEK